MQYKKLANDNNMEVKETWMTAFGKEVGRLAQGDNKTKTVGKNCMFVMTHEQIKDMYARGKSLPMQGLSWISGLKNLTQTESGLQQEVT